MRSPSRPLAPGDTPTHAKRTSAQEPRARDPFQVPAPRLEPSGPAGHAGLSRAGASGGWPEGGVGPQKSQQFSISPPAKTSRGARREGLARRHLRTPERAAPLAPRPREPNARAPNWRTRGHRRCGTDRPHGPALEGPGRRAGGSGARPRGPPAVTATPPPPRPLDTPSLRQSPPAAARRLPGAQLPGSPAPARAPGKGGGAGRVGTARDGGQSSHVGC